MTSRIERAAFAAAVLAVLAAGGFGLFAYLGDAAWQSDEPVYRNAARAYLEFGNFSHNLEHPMLGKYAIGASESLLGTDAWATRLPSAIATLLGGLLVAALGWVVARDALRAGEDGTPDARAAARLGAWSALAAGGTWLVLPHPGPSFDVTRLAYLDALMAMFIAGALWAGWRWGRAFETRWALITGLLAGAAVATKFPALFLVVPLALLVVVGPHVARLRARVASFAIVAGSALVVPALSYLPLAGDLPRALRFAGAMQARDVDQELELAGRSYTDAPVWTQAWWQWDDWPAFALVQLAALVLVWWLLPRRGAAYLFAAVAAPALAYAVGGGRILPHWQVTWQVAMCALVGVVAVRLVVGAAAAGRGSRPLRIVTVGAGLAMLAVVAAGAGARLVDVHRGDATSGGTAAARGSETRRDLEPFIEVADRPGRFVVDGAGVRLARSVSYARALDARGRLQTTYHSAADRQQPWVTRDGGRPQERTQRDLDRDPPRIGDVLLVVLPRGALPAGLPIEPDLLETHYVRHELGDLDVWLNNDLQAPRSDE